MRGSPRPTTSETIHDVLARGSVLGTIAIIALGLGACGLSVVGAAPEETGAVSGADAAPSPIADSTTDDAGGNDNTVPPPPPCISDACAPLDVPGFAIALYGDRATACPSGFTSADVVRTPSAQPDACACGTCAPSATCTTGTIGTKYSSDTKCDNPAGTLSANDGDCFAFNGVFVSTYCSVQAPPPVLGPCSAPGVSVPAKLSADATTHLCHPTADSCAQALCAPPPSMNACLVAAGDVACPPSAPNKTLVGSEPDVTCGACSCTSTATCTGSVTFYSNSGCTGSTKVLTTDVCTIVNQANFKSTKWAGTVTGLSCTNVTPATPTAVGLKDVRTVCCPP